MYRWAEITDKVRELIGGRKVRSARSRAVGRVIYWVTGGRLDGWFLKQEQSGGPMMEQGIHCSTRPVHSTDDVVEVHAFGGNTSTETADLTIHDTVQANLRFAKGTVGHTCTHGVTRAGYFRFVLSVRSLSLLWTSPQPDVWQGAWRGRFVSSEG